MDKPCFFHPVVIKIQAFNDNSQDVRCLVWRYHAGSNANIERYHQLILHGVSLNLVISSCNSFSPPLEIQKLYAFPTQLGPLFHLQKGFVYLDLK
jgi:hypothetical protein